MEEYKNEQAYLTVSRTTASNRLIEYSHHESQDSDSKFLNLLNC
jgi:hypothetical protein